jgi:hypothetical protein
MEEREMKREMYPLFPCQRCGSRQVRREKVKRADRKNQLRATALGMAATLLTALCLTVLLPAIRPDGQPLSQLSAGIISVLAGTMAGLIALHLLERDAPTMEVVVFCCRSCGYRWRRFQ